MDRGPARLELDPAPAKAVGAAVAILSAWIPVEHLRLGGGTALEARWHHRSSTDLDYDFAVARSLAPDDLAYAWSALTDGMKREALTAYRSLAQGGGPGVFRALEKPKGIV